MNNSVTLEKLNKEETQNKLIKNWINSQAFLR